MRKLLLATSSRTFVVAFLLLFALSFSVVAQTAVRVTKEKAKTSSSKTTGKHYKKKKKKKTRVIVHHSDDDKKLKEIKDAKNKEKTKK